MPLSAFHPVIQRWFRRRLGEPTAPQAESWPAISAGHHTLIAAPTGTGKTLAAFLSSLDRLIRLGLSGALDDRTEVVYVSPLRALSADVRKNLEGPLAELNAEALEAGLLLPPIRVGLRTGDTEASERQAQVRRPPHILVTTPESLALCLTAEKSRHHLRAVRTVIVDEIHALIQDKRGSHLLLSLERLDAWCEESGSPPPQRIGLSATVHPIVEVARYLVGSHRVRPDDDGVLDDGQPDCHIVERWGLRPPSLEGSPPVSSERAAVPTAAAPALLRELDLRICTPKDPLGPLCTTEQWQDVHDQLAALIEQHKTTLVFVSTRRLAERTAHSLAERLGDGAVMAHHGSLSRGMRLLVEDRLKSGQLKAVVATASLELGIDIGAIDLVCQLGSPRAIATFLQRVGRANHRPDVSAVPRGRLFALTRDELCEAAALLSAIAAGRLDRQRVPECPLDVLAQQLVAWCSTDERDETWLYERARRAWPFRGLSLDDYHQVLTVLADGVATRRGRPSAHLHWDRVGGKLRGRRGAHLFVLQNGGTIPEPNDYEVVKEPEGVVIGRLDEEFVVESSPGDVFLLGSSAWRLQRVSSGRAHVVAAGESAPTVPFWAGEAPGRTLELSQEVAVLRKELERHVEQALLRRRAASPSSGSDAGEGPVALHAEELPELMAHLTGRCGLEAEAARQLVEYLVASRLALGALPTHDTLIAERFFDEGGGMQLILHAPFGARVNRAFGLALRKKFCRTFNFELQAAATDDGVLLSLGETHSFPLESVWDFVKAERVEHILSQAVLGAPVFQPHFRHVATRALQIPRQRSGKKLPPPIVRILAEDLLAAVFPNAAACPENLPGGDIEIPDHPLVQETLRECLREVMDIDALRGVLRGIESGAVRVIARDTAEPSPLAQHLLFAAPYAFLDDTPAEERRTRAVAVRKPRGSHLPDEVLPYAPESGPQSGLDPAAVEAVRRTAWPRLRDADELHDALLGLYLLPRGQCDFLGELSAATTQLITARRATLLYLGDEVALVASERAAAVRCLFTAVAADEPGARPAPRFVPEPPPIAPRPGLRLLPLGEAGADERVLVEAVRGWLAVTGPWRTAELARALSVPVERMSAALLALESEGMALRGRFLPVPAVAVESTSTGEGAGDVQFCDRRLLLQIHRHVKQTFRRSIEPATPAQLWQLLARWQHAWPGTQLDGTVGLLRLMQQLQGFVAGAASWEEQILPLRLRGYDPAWLDSLCLAGEVAWGRLVPMTGEGRLGRLTPLSLWRRADTMALLPPRPSLSLWTAPQPEADGGEGRPRVSELAVALVQILERRGARFFAELCRECGRPPREVAAALGELVAAGLCSSDGFAGLRLLLSDAGDQAAAMSAGRWALLEGPGAPPEAETGRARFRGTQPLLRSEQSFGAEADWDNPAILEAWVSQYLLRYGAITRELLSREPLGPPMSVAFPLLRRMEARGVVRSGYFVSGLSGEQFMTPEAWTGLELIRKEARGRAPVEVRIGAADPLNLAGILFPGPRVPSTTTATLLYRDGEPVAPEPAAAAAAVPSGTTAALLFN